MRHFGSLLWLVSLLAAIAARAPAQPRAFVPVRIDPVQGVRLAVGNRGLLQGDAPQGSGPAIDIVDRLRAQLAQPGPEGLAEREIAIERLLSLAEERAHAVLRERLASGADPDGVRAVVLRAMARHLLNPADLVFGLREDLGPQRDRLVRSYAATLSAYWQGPADADGLLPADAVRDLARTCLVRMPVLPLEDGLRQVAADANALLDLRVAALRAAGDTQNLQFGRMLAAFVANDDPDVRRAARMALRYLTFAEDAIEKPSQYDEWFQRLGSRRYLDIAEEAARAGARRAREQREELLRVQQQAASDIVRALTERRVGIDWTMVQQKTLADDPGTVKLCLQQLQKTLLDATFGDDMTARHAFARALLQRYRSSTAESRQPRAQLLEVASYLGRTSEVELATELAGELLLQLGGNEPELQLAALRGLRRYPSPEARAAVVRLAQAALQQGTAGDALLAQALQTLGTGGEAVWRAPIDGAPDRAAWLELVRNVCAGPLSRERRNEGIAVGLQLDRDNKRVPEVFDLLLELANDGRREPEYRTTCLIHMQGFRDLTGRSDLLVTAHTQLLGDPERDVRMFVADALSRLPDGTEDQKKNWISRIVAALRERLPVETNMAVLGKMLDCLVACSRGPVPPGAAIGALNVVLDGVSVPVPQDGQQRADALLRALTTIAADPLADQGQWIGACDMLLRHERRRMLRHVLESHNAVLLAKEVRNGDATVAQRARTAMRYLLLAALLKPSKESWQSTAELKSEANDVRIAFEALPPNERLPENLQEPRFRLLRLDVLLANGRSQEATALGTAWIEEKDPKDYAALTPGQVDLVRMFVAEALLLEGKVEAAAAGFARVGEPVATETRAVELAERIGRAFATTDAKKAVEWFERVVRGTAEDEAAYRARLVALWQARIKANPVDRDTVLAEIDKKAALFDAPDCPEELKDAIKVLRGKG